MRYLFKILLFFVSLLLFCYGNYNLEANAQQDTYIQNNYQKVILVTQNFNTAEIYLSANNNDDSYNNTHLKIYHNKHNNHDISTDIIAVVKYNKYPISKIVESYSFIRAP